MLASCSPWFDSRLKMRKTMREEIELDPFLDNLEVFYAVLTYFYTGQITIDRANVSEVLRASDVFGVAKLRAHCCEYLARHFLGPRDVFAAFSLAARYGLPDLLRQSANFIWRGFEQFWDRPELMDMGPSTVQGLLKARSWPVSQELLLNFITRWVSWHPQVREALLVPLLDYVNWQDVNAAFVSQHLDKEELYVSSQDALYNILLVLDRNAVYLGPKWQETFQALQERILPEQDLDELNDTNSFLTIAINSAVKDLEHSDVDPDWFLQNEPDNSSYANPRSDHSLMPPPPAPGPPPPPSHQQGPATQSTLPPTHPPAPPPLPAPSTSFSQSQTAPPASPSPVLPSRVESGKLEKYGSKTDAPSIDLEIVDQVISEHEQRMMNEEKIRLTSAKRFDPKFRALTEAFRQNSLEEEGQSRLANEAKEIRPTEAGQTTKVVVVDKAQLDPTPPSPPPVPPKQRPRLRQSKCDDYVSPESPPPSDIGDLNDDDGHDVEGTEANVRLEAVTPQVAETKRDTAGQITSTRPRLKRPRLLDDKIDSSAQLQKVPSQQGHVKKAKLLAEHRSLKQEEKHQGGQNDGEGNEVVSKQKEDKSPSNEENEEPPIEDVEEDYQSVKQDAESTSKKSESAISPALPARPTVLLKHPLPTTPPQSRPRLAPIRLRCQFCPDFTTKKRKEMAAHVKHEHFADSPPFLCPHDSCSYQSQRLSKLVAHMETHAAEPALRCPEAGCTYITKTKSRLAVHRLNHDKKHSCHVCGKLFPSANAVKLHQVLLTSLINLDTSYFLYLFCMLCTDRPFGGTTSL